MKKSPLHRTTSLVLAMLMLFTSVGFSADVHFCKGEFKSLSLIGEAQSCHTSKKSCPHHTNMEVSNESEKDCCSNKTFEVDDLDTDFNVSSDLALTDLQFKFIASLAYSFFISAPPKVVKSTFLDTLVPLHSKDIYVLLERFLI